MTQADENAAIVRRGYEAFNSADMPTLTELFDENVSWHTPGRGILAGATLLDVLTSDDGRVVGIHNNSAERNGKHLNVGCCIVFELKDGRVVDGSEHFYDLYAWDEFWS